MQQLGRPERLLLVVGCRLWPALDALAQWGPDAREVLLLAAHGDEESGGPMERIERFVLAQLPHLRTRRLPCVFDDDPTALAEALVGALADAPHTLVDVSGGTRLMFAGGVLAADRAGDHPVVYRDAHGPWYQLMPGGRARQLDVPRRATERFSLDAILDVTWGDDERRVRVVRPHLEPQIVDAARRHVQRRRSWRKEFDGAVRSLNRGGSAEQRGPLFERFVLALVRELGVSEDDVALGVTLVDDGRTIQEVDVVVNCDGWLHVIDCKLADTRRRPGARGGYRPSPIGTQIREAFTTTQDLGDGAVRFVLLRPNSELDAEFRDLCDEYRIAVVDGIDLARAPLVDHLRRLLRPPAGRAQTDEARTTRS